MPQLTQRDADWIERMIDNIGLEGLLATVSEICYLKAQHIEENWNDTALARAWSRAGQIVDKAGSAVNRLGIP
jgi:hypothetical protein